MLFSCTGWQANIDSLYRSLHVLLLAPSITLTTLPLPSTSQDSCRKGRPGRTRRKHCRYSSLGQHLYGDYYGNSRRRCERQPYYWIPSIVRFRLHQFCSRACGELLPFVPPLTHEILMGMEPADFRFSLRTIKPLRSCLRFLALQWPRITAVFPCESRKSLF